MAACLIIRKYTGIYTEHKSPLNTMESPLNANFIVINDKSIENNGKFTE